MECYARSYYKGICTPACRCYLLLRFYDPTGGAIYLDGHDLRDLSVASLRGHVAMVWQEPFLLDNSVRANLLSVIFTETIPICTLSYIQHWVAIIETLRGRK